MRLTNKERFDIDTMEYFIPRNSKRRIYPGDRLKMSRLSSRGIFPTKVTPGFTLLKWGKTYRDEQITSYKRDIALGLFTKSEILSGLPVRLRSWMWEKIKDVPYDQSAYDESGVVTGLGVRPLLISVYKKEL